MLRLVRLKFINIPKTIVSPPIRLSRLAAADTASAAVLLLIYIRTHNVRQSARKAAGKAVPSQAAPRTEQFITLLVPVLLLI